MIDSTLSTRNSHIHARQNRGTSAHLLDALLVAGLFGTAAANGATGPSIYMQPQSQTVTIWHEATFSVLAGGTEPLSYQWSRSGTVIPGATSNTYTTPPVAPSEDGATFTVIVSNAAGSVASQPAKLAVVALRAAPAITTQPIDQTVLAGQTARFTVVATGTAPLMYQWRRNGIEIRFASESSYTTPPASAADNGAQFTVIVSNRYGRVTSRAAVLTVNAPAMAPTITTQPQSVTVTAGQTATFSVVASGTAPLSYQWKKNSTAISGATAASYTTPATATTDSGSTFTVTVSNTAGSVTSSAATLTVNAAGDGAHDHDAAAERDGDGGANSHVQRGGERHRAAELSVPGTTGWRSPPPVQPESACRWTDESGRRRCPGCPCRCKSRSRPGTRGKSWLRVPGARREHGGEGQRRRRKHIEGVAWVHGNRIARRVGRPPARARVWRPAAGVDARPHKSDRIVL